MKLYSIKAVLPWQMALLLLILAACGGRGNPSDRAGELQDSILAAEEARAIAEEGERSRPRTKEDIVLRKELLFEEYSLADTYEHEGSQRSFQWEKIKEKLALIETFQRRDLEYALVQNYKNGNGESPLVRNFVRNEYKRVSDTLGTERYQSAPLYRPEEWDTPLIYGRDGSLVALHSADTLEYMRIEGLSFEGVWDIPNRYVKKIGKDIRFEQVIVVDVTHQHICTLEKQEDAWLVRSMNPATTGVHRPPFAHETPLGMFVIQEKKEKMYFLVDGSRTEIAGFAPYASRFTNGGYIHGIPTNYPQQSIIEYSWSLGTIPRSHMCVRNASSHAKFIYEWAQTLASLVIVID